MKQFFRRHAQRLPSGSTENSEEPYFLRNTNGLPTQIVEKWVDNGSALFRTNTFSYAANLVDMTLHIGPNNEQVSSNVFNAYHLVTTNYDALNQAMVFTYDGTRLQLTSITRPTGLITTNVYDGNHRLQQTTDSPINATRSYTWYDNGNVKAITDERGLTVTNYWDGLNRLTGTKHPDGTTTTNLYTVSSAYPNSSGGLNILDVTATKDRLGYWTYFGYDALRRTIAMTNANNVVTRYGYCDCGQLQSITNAWGATEQMVTSFDYDYQGHRLYTYLPDATVTNWFDSLGRVTATADYWATKWFGYNNQGLLIGITNYYGTEQYTVFDIEDRPIYVTDANNVTVTNTYDLLGRLSTRTYPDAGVERFGYSARGLTAYTNQLDKITYYVYDEATRKTYETNANSEIIRYTNSAAGDLLSLTDGKGQTTKWNYDTYGRVTNKVDQASVEILRYSYDADSRLTNRWSKAKTNTVYSYDAVGNLTNINYPASTDIKYQHDALNRLTNMVDASGTNKYTYTSGGLLWTEDSPWASDTVTNTYYNRMRTNLSLAQPTGSWTNQFGYDAARRLTNVTSQAGSFAYTYHASRITLLDKLLLANTSYITNTYDTMARLTGTYLKTSGNVLTNKHEYTYNAGNQRTQQTFMDAATYGYTYDKIGQLTNADSSVAAQDRKYVYDAAWNLNYRTNNTTAYTFNVDGKNQLTNGPSASTQTYDDNGNLTHSSGTDNGYSYDDENQLVNWYYYDGGKDGHGSPTTVSDFRTEFVYDGKGRLRKRVEYTTDGSVWIVSTETRYIYDGMRVIQERNSSNTPTVGYTRGTDLSGSLEGAGGIGGLLGRANGTSGNLTNHSVYHADGNGNVTYMLNSSQSKVAEYRYDPFGNSITTSGTLSAANVYRFSSKEIHVNSGLYYYGYRFYHPNLQRWLNRDPFFGELNTAFPANNTLQRNAILASEVSQLYGFCFNYPVNTFDTDGLIAPIPILMAGLAIGNCAIGAYELNEYFKCMDRARQINKQATEKLPTDEGIDWCRKNRGQECTELLQDAAGRGLRCGLWGAGRFLLIRLGINPILGGKTGVR